MSSSSECSVIFDTTKLAIERSLCSNINQIISVPKKQTEEIEVRFGYVSDGKNFSGLHISAAESRKKWYTLLNLLSDSGLYNPMKIEKSTTETYGSGNGIRKITDIGVPSEPVYQEKVRKHMLDVLNYSVGNMHHIIRLAVSDEIPRKNIKPTGKVEYKRTRMRASFVAKDLTHRFDLTYVDGGSYEVEIEYLTNLDLQAFFRPIKLVVHVIKGDGSNITEVVTTTEYSEAIRAFNNFFPREKFDRTVLYRKELPQPTNLKRDAVKNLVAYSVTNKLNGVRMIGVFTDNYLYLIDGVNRVIKFSQSPPEYNGTVIDTEYFKNQVYAFDILFHNKQDVRPKPLDQRLNMLESIRLSGFSVKRFFMSGNLRQDTIDVLKIVDTDPEDNDGVIYTPTMEPYFNNHIYKWKPPSQLTIDFYAVPMGSNKYYLQVYTKDYKRTKKFETFIVPGFPGIIESDTNIVQGVGEFEWDFVKKTFRLVKPRPDKELPNFSAIAQSVWDDIQHPITREILLELLQINQEGARPGVKKDDRDANRKYHNIIKRDLIMTYMKDGTVIDLGAGKGGDLNKYQDAKVKQLYAVEPNPVNIAEMSRRLSSMPQSALDFKNRVVMIPARAQDTQLIATEMKGRKVSGGAMFFSLSFFFENAMVLNGLLATIDRFIDKDGVFVGTTIDGNRVKELFNTRKSPIVNLDAITLKKDYEDFKDNEPIGFGRRVLFKYSGSQTVADEQVEYLVDWNMFVNKLTDLGFVVENSSYFNTPDYLTENEKTASSLYRQFVFRRTREKVVQKAIEAQKKKHLGMAKVGENRKLASVLSNDLVRTGTHANGDCFFHAVLTSINADYRKAPAAQQVEMARTMRATLETSMDKWMALGNGSLARVGIDISKPGFDGVLRIHLLNEAHIYEGSNRNIIKAFRNPDMIKAFLTDVERKNQKQDLNTYINILKAEFAGRILVNDYKEQAVAEFNDIIEIAKVEAHQNFVSLVETCGKWVGQEVLELVSDSVGRDIFIVEDTEGAPYKTECIHVRNRLSIILLFQGGTHYESVGEMIKDTKKIRREFEANDRLIVKIKEIVCK